MTERQAIHAAHDTTLDTYDMVLHREVDDNGETWIVEKVAPEAGIIERSMIAPEQSLTSIPAWV
jgi:hypothetical protein